MILLGVGVLTGGCASTGSEAGHTSAKTSGRWPSGGEREGRRESAASYRQLAEKYHREHRPEVACQLYEKVLAQGAKDPQLHYLLAHALGTTGRYDEGVRHAREAVRLRPDFAEAKTLLAVLLRREGNNAEAIRLFEENWRSDHPSPTDAAELAKWHLIRGDKEWGLPILETARRRWPTEARFEALMREYEGNLKPGVQRGTAKAASGGALSSNAEFPPLTMGESFP